MGTVQEHLLLLLRSAFLGEEAPRGEACATLTEVYALACKQGVEHIVTAGILCEPAISEQLRACIEDRSLRWQRTLATREYYSEQIYISLSEAQIKWMPLKGAIFATYYPRASMRTSSDLDLLYDKDQCNLEDLTRVLQKAGATKWEYGKEHSRFWFDDFLVEMHPVLFATNDYFYDYFSRVWERSVKQEIGYAMQKEDAYLHLVAHMVKHLLEGGIGIRSLCDLYLFLRAEVVDREYLNHTLAELGLLRFSQNMELLAEACFSRDGVLSDPQKKWLAFFLSGDMYGNQETRDSLCGRGAITTDGRIGFRYYLRRLFPRYRDMKWLFPILEDMPILLPFCYVSRIIKMLFFGRKRLATELKKIASVDRMACANTYALYLEMGIDRKLISGK